VRRLSFCVRGKTLAAASKKNLDCFYFLVAKGKILGISNNPVIIGHNVHDSKSLVVVSNDFYELNFNMHCLRPTFLLKLFNGYMIVSCAGK
jgi:hypothetical protein